MHVPDARDEAIRDLCRARTDAVRDQRRSRQQLKALLLRLGYHYGGKNSWTEAHLRYLRELEMGHPAQKVVLEEYLIAVSQASERIARLSGQIELQVATWRMKPAVETLMALRSAKKLDRFSYRGQVKVNIQWLLYCLVHNIEKIAHYGKAITPGSLLLNFIASFATSGKLAAGRIPF